MEIHVDRFAFLYNDGQFDLLQSMISQHLSVGLSHYSEHEQLEILYYALAINLNERNDELLLCYEQALKGSSDVKHLARFGTIRATYAELSGQKQQATALWTSLLQWVEPQAYHCPEVYATTLGNAMRMCIETAQYEQAIQLYAAAHRENLARVFALSPKTYFHIHDNLLHAYAARKQWRTAQMLIEALLNMPEMLKYPRYHQLLTIAYGYIISQHDIEKGVRICLPIVKEINCFEMNRLSLKFAYEKWIDILERYGDEGLLAQYKKRAANV